MVVTEIMKYFTLNMWYLFISCVMISMTICVIISVAQGIIEFKDWIKERFK